MTTAECPFCHGAITSESRSGPCPHCGRTSPDTGANDPASVHTVVVGGPAVTATEAFDFLLPPSESGEIGWLAHYRVLRLIGRGGMGIVFEANDTQLNRPVALKVLSPELARAPDFRQRFLREAQAAAAVGGEHVVSIFHIGEANDVPYFAMELLAGESLEARLLRQPQLPVAEVLRIGREIATGLAEPHSRGLVHRDIKPGNVWLQSPAGRVKLLDFGLAYQADSGQNLTRTGVILGTPAYMAPEQADGVRVDARADLFSLGCILYQMAAGRPPFSGSTAMSILKAVALHEPPSPSGLGVAVPAGFDNLLAHLLSKRPEGRPASATEVADALRGMEAGGSPASISFPALAPYIRPSGLSRRRAVVLATGAGSLILAGILTAMWLRRDSVPAVAGSGAAPPEILFGMSAAFSGPSRELGRDVQNGIQTCFEQVNEEGGVKGQRLRLVALDDGYEPDRALANMHDLYERYHVLGTIGNIGTPTAEKVLPYVFEQNRLFFAGFTGAKLLRRQPPDRLVFNYRASYDEETAALVKYLLDIRKIPVDALAVFAQQDSYGEAGYEGVARTLRQRGFDPDRVLRVGYARNSLDVTAAADRVLAQAGVRAVVMVAIYQPAARFILRVKTARPDIIFGNISLVGGEELAEEMRTLSGKGAAAAGVVVTQVVPPVTSNSSAVSHYRERLKNYFPSERPSSASLEGFVAANLLVEGLRRAGPAPTTDGLVLALESIKDLDPGIGTSLGFAPSEHQASHKIWGTEVDDRGALKEIDLD
jgi:eukaryotic-like serine/threonine-protein kinase